MNKIYRNRDRSRNRNGIGGVCHSVVYGAWNAPYLAYSYTDYTFDDFSEPVDTGATTINVDRSGNSLPLVPEDQFSLFVFYRPSGGFRLRMETW